MRKEKKISMLLAALLALVMLLYSFPVYAEDANTEIPAEEITQETTAKEEMEAIETAKELPEEEPAAAEIPEEIPAEEPAASEPPEVTPAEEPAAPEPPEVTPTEEPVVPETPETIPAEEPAVPETPEVTPEEEPEAPETPETDPEEEPEDPEAQDEESEEDLVWFDDDDPGSVAPELLDLFNNPDAYRKVEFTGTVEIEIKDETIAYDQEVTLVARVSDTESMDYLMVWEASDDEGITWHTVGSGEEYTFVLTRENVNRAYRVVLYAAN